MKSLIAIGTRKRSQKIFVDLCESFAELCVTALKS